MKKINRRNFGKRTLLLAGMTALGLPGGASAFFDKIKKNTFLKRDDLSHALKSYYMTYDSTTPYPHKFNEVVSKTQMRSLQFHIDHGLEKDYVQHYITTMEPLLLRVKQLVEKEGTEKGLYSMFEGTSCAYQLFENINISPGQRTMPCPYKELLGYCRKYLGTFTIEWQDICNKWCTPTWTGFAEKIGITVAIEPGETCTVKLIEPKQQP